MRARARATTMAIATAVVVVALAATGVARADPVHDVAIFNNYFEPPVVRVDPGDSVRWTLQGGIHTVTSEDGRFASGTLDQAGQTFEYVTPDEDVRLDYLCSIHGSAMAGVIIVGQPPTTIKPVEVRLVPSDAWPSLWDALTGIDPEASYRIELAPGVHTVHGREVGRHTRSMGNINVPLPQSFDLTIRGVGAEPGDVVIEGGLAVANLTGFHLERVKVQGGTSGAAVMIGSEMRQWFLEDVVIDAPGDFGVRAWKGARFGTVRNVTVDGADIAGISVENCVDCDIVIDGAVVSGSLQGMSLLNAASVVVRGSTLANNGAGISVKTTVNDRAPARGIFMSGNTITASTSRERTPDPSASLDLPVGAGIWLHGVSFVEVLANEITTASFGIAITGPSYGHRVRGNTIADTMDADLGWDGVGANVCFAQNTAPARAVTSMPPEAQILYACDRPATIGVPYPIVSQKILAWGLGLPGP